jgi:hypothetical protein
LFFITLPVTAQTLPPQKISSVQRVKFGQIDRTATGWNNANTNFFLAGKKLYEIGMMDGSFPTDNDRSSERGVWCQPVKLLDCFEYGISEKGQKDRTLVNSMYFEHNFYSAITTDALNH